MKCNLSCTTIDRTEREEKIREVRSEREAGEREAGGIEKRGRENREKVRKRGDWLTWARHPWRRRIYRLPRRVSSLRHNAARSPLLHPLAHLDIERGQE